MQIPAPTLRSCDRDFWPLGPIPWACTPSVGTALVFLAAIAWTGTILTMLIAVVKARRRPLAEVRRSVHAEAQTADGEAA